MTSDQVDTPPFKVRVTLSDENGWDIEFGEEMEKFTDESKLYALSKILSDLALRLSRCSVSDDDDEWDDDDDE